MQQGSGILDGASGGVGTATLPASLTDEQILGLEASDGGSSAGREAGGSTMPAGAPSTALDTTWGLSSGPARAEAESIGANRDGRNGPPSAGAAAEPANEPAWLKALEAQPEAAAQAHEWRAAANDVTALDAAYFGGDAGARAGLAARLYESDPSAFRAMLMESTRLLGERDPQALAELGRLLGATGMAPAPAAQAPAAKSVANAARDLAPSSAQENHGAFPAEAYRAFESATNQEVAHRVHDAIDRVLGATLPPGTAEGAQRRIADDIFREVHASLSADRELTRQVGEALRNWRFDPAAQQQVTALLTGRARAVLPEVARRVVGEWTSSVLASDRAKSARMDAAAARRDVTGGRLLEPIPASALRPRDIDYSRVSDAQILDL